MFPTYYIPIGSWARVVVLKELEVPGRMQAVKIEPQESFQPFYMKLRAEADDALLGNGEGPLYVGFHVDPLYRVHWITLVALVKYQVTASKGTTVSPEQGKGLPVEEVFRRRPQGVSPEK